MNRILIIEDEVKTANSIKQGLEENSFLTETAYDGNSGLRLARKGNYDLIICDVILPGQNGKEICRSLRAEQIHTPVLMLTALNSVSDKLEGFDSGVDDYLSKPFEFRELLARVRALLKRHPQIVQTATILKCADLELNLDTRKAVRSGRTIDLTLKEFALLEYFMQHANRVLSKAELAERVWGIDFDTGTNVIEVYVNYLRKKLEAEGAPRLIHTEFGMGYILKDQA
ncbi:MAG: response regulator transcription factor [Bacteroidia bacterium]|nr:response regulator transcription factor [Bacteroidia bacterium]